MRLISGVLTLLGGMVVVAGCGGDDSGAPAPVVDASPDSKTSDAGDVAAALNINGCTTYVDRTGASDDREIEWKFLTTLPAEWCMKVKVGQSVVWKTSDAGGFNTHPLGAFGGDSGNPINAAGIGDVTSHAFLEGGKTFGFRCSIHTNMQGAIYVVP